MRNFSYALKDAHGFQHCHGDDCDEFFFRPIMVGKEMMAYVAHVPPGGGVSGDEEEQSHFEQSIYVLQGTLTVTKGEGTPAELGVHTTVDAHEAFCCLRGHPYGKWNLTDQPVSYLCTFTYVPEGVTSPEDMKENAERDGREFFSPDAMNQMAGDLLSR